MEFEHQGRIVELQATPKPEINWMTNEQLLAAIQKDDSRAENQYFLVQLVASNTKETTGGSKATVSAENQATLEKILSKFEIFFAEPKSLPPKRDQDHIIHLKSSESISVKPYRYPVIQKDAME